MESRFGIIVGPGCGKTAALSSAVLRLVETAMGVRKRVFISFNFDELLDGKRRLLEILHELDKDANAGEWSSLILLGDPDQSVCSFRHGLDNLAVSCAELRSIKAQLRSIILSAVDEIDRAVEVFFSLLETPDHPVAEFLLERRWHFLHTSHPPRTLLTAVSDWSLGRACSPLVSAN